MLNCKNKVKYIFLIFFLLNGLNSVAQKNQIAFGLQGVQYLDTYNKVISPVEFTHLTFRKQIKNKFYAFANINFRTDLYYADRKTNKLSPNTQEGLFPVGSLLWRDDYDYFDIGVHYNVYKFNQHELSLSSGISYGRGKNIFLKDAKYIIYRGEEIPIAINLDTKTGHYAGGVFSLLYNYSYSESWKAGSIISYRLYNQDFPSLINYGIYLSCDL